MLYHVGNLLKLSPGNTSMQQVKYITIMNKITDLIGVSIVGNIYFWESVKTQLNTSCLIHF